MLLRKDIALLRAGVLHIDLVDATALAHLLVVVALELILYLLGCSLVPGAEDGGCDGAEEGRKDVYPADIHFGVRLLIAYLVCVADVSVERLAEAEGRVQACAGAIAELEAEGLHIAKNEGFDKDICLLEVGLVSKGQEDQSEEEGPEELLSENPGVVVAAHVGKDVVVGVEEPGREQEV